MLLPITVSDRVVYAISETRDAEMKNVITYVAPWLIFFFCGCSPSTGVSASDTMLDELAAAEAVIDAFYSWDSDRLETTLSNARVLAPQQVDRALYYQAWAQAGHYMVQTRRSCEHTDEAVVACAITVTDDIGGALGYIATDTFHMNVNKGRVIGIDSTSDDPPVLEEVFAWLAQTRPEVLAGPCKDLFAGGTTPAECVQAVVQGARDFVARAN